MRIIAGRWLLLWVIAFGLFITSASAADAGTKKVVFIAGAKSHGPGAHEYEKGLRLVENALKKSPGGKSFETVFVANGWPDDDAILDDAATIVMFCDGSDHDERSHPILHGERLKKIDGLMKKGIGFIAIHYTVFVPSNRGGAEFLDWIGGYFDYQNGPAANHWYSKISTQTTRPKPATPEHPICRGLAPFELTEEYYYNIRFTPNDARWKPILTTTIPGEEGDQVVAWAVDRQDGGRGFGFTGGHFHANWGVENFRKMVLNAVVWTAHGEVPAEGITSPQPTAEDLMPGPSTPGAIVEAAKEPLIRALILTGYNGPFHDWRATSAALKISLERDPRFRVTVNEDPEFLATGNLDRFDLIVQNYVNWDHPSISEKARENLVTYLKKGKGIALIHFANGAFRNWPEYQKMSRRNWVDGKSNHDPYGAFRVEVTSAKHPITEGMTGFDTTDELYFDQQGELPIEPLVTARSKVADRDAPLAFAYEYEGANVFQILLGHDAASITNPGAADLIRRGCAWAGHAKVIGFRDEPPAPIAASAVSNEPIVEGKFGKAVNPSAIRVQAGADEAYSKTPLTVECWAKLDRKDGFNILVANHPKESGAHWEVYSYAGSGCLAVYMPGMTPAEMVSKVNIVDGQWHYVAWIYESGRSRLFVDGKNVLDVQIASNLLPAVPGPLCLGGIHSIGLGCAGVIDEVRISNIAREISAVPQQTFEADEHTLNLWHFDNFEKGFDDAGKLKSPALEASAATSPPPAIQKAAGPSSDDSLDYQPTDPALKAILIDRSSDESFLAVKLDTAGRIFVGAREALFVYEPKSDGSYEKKRELFRFPPDSWLAGIEVLGDDLYVTTCSALYRLQGARLKREGIKAERLVWGIPVDLHVSMHGLALGPEGDLYFTAGDPLLNYGDFARRPDHWGHWTFFSQPEGTRTPYTGQGGVFRCRPDGSEFQVVARGTRGSNGMVFDSAWNLFTNDNDHESLPALYTPGKLLHVTPHAEFGWPRGWTAARTPERTDLLPSIFNGMGRAVPVGMSYYDEEYLPQFRNNLLLARWCTLQVTNYPLKENGASFTADEHVLLSGKESARPVGVAVGRGGRIFAAIAYMTQNEWSPRYISDLVLITRKDDPESHPFEPYEAPNAAVEYLWKELESKDWQNRYAAHEEILRRGENDKNRLTAKLQRDKSLTIQEDKARLKHMDDPEAYSRLMVEKYPQLYLAELNKLMDFRGKLDNVVISSTLRVPGASADPYLRQAATMLVGKRGTVEQIMGHARDPKREVRMAVVLALGYRLTVPAATTELPEELPLNYSSENALFVIQYADAKIDLKQKGRVGSFTIAEAWKHVKHTEDQEATFATLSSMLEDEDTGAKFMAAYFLDLLEDARIQPKIELVRAENVAAKLAGQPKKPVDRIWIAGPFDESEADAKARPEKGAIALDAVYRSGSREIAWTEATSDGPYELDDPRLPSRFAYYAYFRFQSNGRLPVRLEVGHRDSLTLWMDGKIVWENAGVKGAVPTSDTVQLELQPGSNDLLLRLRGESPVGFAISYQAPPGVEVVHPERLGMAGLSERLKSAADDPENTDISHAFSAIDWKEEVKKGNPFRGAKIFGVDGIGCAKCHSMREEEAGGGGPSLAGAGKRFTLDYLIESVLLPSRQIADVFRGTVIETNDGETLTGLVTGETGEKVDMLLSDATKRSIPKSNIKERRVLQLSPMPQGLVKTPEELRDLMVFLLGSDNIRQEK